MRKTTSPTRNIAAGICLTVGLTLGSTALAATTISNTVSFSIKASDLGTAQSVAVLYEELSNEAREQCTYNITGTRIDQVDYACASDLLDDFIVSIADEGLARVHQVQTAG